MTTVIVMEQKEKEWCMYQSGPFGGGTSKPMNPLRQTVESFPSILTVYWKNEKLQSDMMKIELADLSFIFLPHS